MFILQPRLTGPPIDEKEKSVLKLCETEIVLLKRTGKVAIQLMTNRFAVFVVADLALLVKCRGGSHSQEDESAGKSS